MKSGRKAFKLILGLLITVLFSWLVLRHISWTQLRHAFANVHWAWVWLALFCFLLGYAARAERWRRMLVRVNPKLSWKDCIGPFMACFALNNLLPLRAGDIMRSFAFNAKFGVTSGTMIATLFVERLLDLLMVLLLLWIALHLTGADASIFGNIGGWTLAAIILLIILSLLFPGALAPLVRWSGGLLARLSPKIGARIEQEMLKTVDTLEYLSGKRAIALLILWSVIAWAAEGLVFYFCGKAMVSLSVISAVWLALPVGTLATVLPSTPGYVGTFDFFVFKAMSSMGNSTTASTAYALLVHFMLWLPPTLLGVPFWLSYSIRNKPSNRVKP